MSDEDFTQELRKLGAREFQVVALSADPERALAAIEATRSKGHVEHLIAYALTLFDDPEWRPSGERPRRATNLAAPASTCATCGGDRFVVVATRPVTASVWMKEHGIEPPEGAVEEEYAPCPDCNPQDVSFYRHDGSRFVTPDVAKVRELLGR
jgi:hypothetical protein